MGTPRRSLAVTPVALQQGNQQWTASYPTGTRGTHARCHAGWASRNANDVFKSMLKMVGRCATATLTKWCSVMPVVVPSSRVPQHVYGERGCSGVLAISAAGSENAIGRLRECLVQMERPASQVPPRKQKNADGSATNKFIASGAYGKTTGNALFLAEPAP